MRNTLPKKRKEGEAWGKNTLTTEENERKIAKRRKLAFGYSSATYYQLALAPREERRREGQEMGFGKSARREGKWQPEREEADWSCVGGRLLLKKKRG